MLNGFDWIRRSRTGAELLATLGLLDEDEEPVSSRIPEEKVIGPPPTLMDGPCSRCGVYPRMGESEFCRTCDLILERVPAERKKTYVSIVLWGYVNILPWHLDGKGLFPEPKRFNGAYVHDENHFLLSIQRYALKQWFRELSIYHGQEIRGLIQIFPTMGATKKGRMDDVLARAIHLDSRFPMDSLRIRFYANPFQLFAAHKREEKGMLTFSVGEFINLLDTAVIYRTLLNPEEQELLLKLTSITNHSEERFFWGRLAGCLSAKARDMLDAWHFRDWPRERVALLYELLDYVEYSD